MLKNIDPSDKSIRPFKVYKDFTLTNNDSGSGHFVLRAENSSTFNFQTGSAASQSFGNYIATSSKFEYGTYYDVPNYHMVKHIYYENNEPQRTYGKHLNNKRELGSSAKLFSIPRDLFGEEIKPNSIELEVTTGGVTYTLKDDGDGNIYDNAFSASYAAYKSSSFDRSQGIDSNGSGSQVGNVFYEQGVIVLTDTGSLVNAGARASGTGTIYDGHNLKYKSTRTIYEYEYLVSIEPNEWNLTTNKSTTEGLSGSISIAEGSKDIDRFFPPSDQPTGAGTGSYKTFYNATGNYQGFVSHSEFQPYLTTIGLYNDSNELLVVGKLAKPVKLSKNTNTNIVVRFDI